MWDMKIANIAEKKIRNPQYICNACCLHASMNHQKESILSELTDIKSMKSSYVVTSWCVLDTTDDNDVCGTEPKWSEQLNLFEDVRLSLILFLDFKIRWVVIELAIGCNVFNIHRWLTIYNYSSYAIRQWHILRI